LDIENDIDILEKVLNKIIVDFETSYLKTVFEQQLKADKTGTTEMIDDLLKNRASIEYEEKKVKKSLSANSYDYLFNRSN
jgi:hypothetical protein